MPSSVDCQRDPSAFETYYRIGLRNAVSVARILVSLLASTYSITVYGCYYKLQIGTSRSCASRPSSIKVKLPTSLDMIVGNQFSAIPKVFNWHHGVRYEKLSTCISKILSSALGLSKGVFELNGDGRYCEDSYCLLHH